MLDKYLVSTLTEIYRVPGDSGRGPRGGGSADLHREPGGGRQVRLRRHQDHAAETSLQDGVHVGRRKTTVLHVVRYHTYRQIICYPIKMQCKSACVQNLCVCDKRLNSYFFCFKMIYIFFIKLSNIFQTVFPKYTRVIYYIYGGTITDLLSVAQTHTCNTHTARRQSKSIL